MNINRDYLIINDVKKSNIKLDNGSMFFYITDKNTQNIFVNLVINISNNDLIQKYANIENAEDYTLTMNIVKPSNTYKVVEGKLHDKEKAIFEFDLNVDCCDEIGTYRCELLTKCTINGHEEITTSNKLTYKVKSSVLNDLDDIVEVPEYPLVIQLFDKLSDIEQYEEDRRANELARQLAEEQRQTRFNALDTDITNSIQVIDDKVVDVENRISAKEQAVDKLIVDTKADIDNYKVAKDQEIDEYKTTKDTEINNAITTQDNKIDTAISKQNDRITVVENDVVSQNNRLDIVENKNTQQDNRLTAVEAKNVEQDNRLNAIEAIDVAQNTRLDAIEAKNQQQDDRLLDIEKVNKRQDMNLKCLFAESKNNMIDITEEGNSIYLQNSTTGYSLIDEIKGNTLVNCNKEPNKELILNGNINTSGDNTVTITEGVNGGLVDVALEGNTLVNVSKTKNPTAITKAYTVENSGNHIALQGDVDGTCRPVITGNTLWIDNATGEVLTAFDGTKNLRLQSTFEDNLVTQEMVDTGEEVADNLGKYRVDCKVTGKNLFDGKLELGSYSTSTGVKTNNTNTIRNINLIKLKPNTQYKFSNSSGTVFSLRVYDKDKNYIGMVSANNMSGNNSIFTTYYNCHYINFTLNSTDTTQTIQIEEGDTAAEYEPYKEYTKTLYLNSPLLEGDTIEEKDNGIYHVHRYTKVVLDGSDDESWVTQSLGDSDTTLGFRKQAGVYSKENANALSDRFVYLYSWEKTDHMHFNRNALNITISKSKLQTQDVAGFRQWLQQNPTTIVYELTEPTYELIEQSNLVIPSYASGHLDFNTAVPIEKVDFLPFSEELTYLYANTQYTLQFISYEAITADITLGGTSLLAQSIVAGLNRISITTPATLTDNKLVISGVGTNISEVVVTDTNREFVYFEGMKSVGEGGNLVITSSNSDNTLSNTRQLTHEPLRAVGDVKDRYVLIDGKWYIERNCISIQSKDLKYTAINMYTSADFPDVIGFRLMNTGITSPIICDNYAYSSDKIINMGALITNKECINIYGSEFFITIKKSKLETLTHEALINYLSNNSFEIITSVDSPVYEPINYNPLETYSDITHISTNSTIPTNITIRNHGFNCLLKPNTTYTISSSLGLNTVTTPSTLTEDCLRFMDTDTSDVTTMKNVLVLEGDWTTKADLIPANFSGIESAFEQEYDAEKGKYKVNVKVANEDKTRENNITFYINEPLRGIGDVKDRIYVKNDKVVVERKCGIRPYEDGDFGTYPTDKVNTVYQLAEPTYEEVEYNDSKLFIESFKNSTLSYNSNVPVTSKLYYSYSVPIVDTVTQTANISDEQDNMIIELATQVAVMEMMLM